MTKYWINRLIQAMILWVLASVLVFSIIRLSPVDPAIFLADEFYLTPETTLAIRESLGLTDPLPIQYFKTMKGLFSGELKSFIRKESTTSMLLKAAPVTFSVVLVALFIEFLVAFPLGILAGRKPGGRLDRALSVGIVSVVSFPSFVFALLAIRIFAEEFGWLPAGGLRPPGTTGWNPLLVLPYLILPAMATAFVSAPILARYIRDAMQDVLSEDYIRTAYAKGLDEVQVLWRHALRNVLVPVVSVVGTVLPLTFGGSVIIEQIFFLQGIGKLTVAAAIEHDYPVVVSMALFMAIIVITANLIVDVLYGIVDPRIKIH